MATSEHIGLMTYVDESGNKTLLYPVTKAECVEGLTPSLTESQKAQLVALHNLYASTKARRQRFYYDGNVLRNVYVGDTESNKPFFIPKDENGNPIKDKEGNPLGTRIAVNCGLYVNLLWGGVKPDTFANFIDNPSGFDGTLIKHFDWGYQFMYPNRQFVGLRANTAGKPYGFLVPDENDPEYTDGMGYNTTYNPKKNSNGTFVYPFAQKDFTYATAADMAYELYVNGYEINMKDIEVGDLLFYRARNLSDGSDDSDEAIRFRNITHVAMVIDIVMVDGHKYFSIAESTPMMGSDAYSVCNLKYDSTDGSTKTRLAYLNNKICMVARHPAAFGVASNLGTKFNKI